MKKIDAILRIVRFMGGTGVKAPFTIGGLAQSTVQQGAFGVWDKEAEENKELNQLYWEPAFPLLVTDERPVDGDWYYNFTLERIAKHIGSQVDEMVIDRDDCKRVIALPQQFSAEFLIAIKNGYFNEGETVKLHGEEVQITVRSKQENFESFENQNRDKAIVGHIVTRVKPLLSNGYVVFTKN